MKEYCIFLSNVHSKVMSQYYFGEVRTDYYNYVIVIIRAVL